MPGLGSLERLDGAGAALLPGFIDAHLHLLMAGVNLDRLDLSRVRSRREFEEAIARRHRELPRGAWLIACGWSQAQWGGELPDRSWLRGAEDRPVVAYRMDIHAALVSDAVLRMIGPPAHVDGGRIERDAATGAPTGMLVEAALWALVNPLIPAPDSAQKRYAVRRAAEVLPRYGITAVGAMEYREDLDEAFAPIRAEVPVAVRATVLDRAWPLESARWLGFPGDDNVRVIGAKAFADGTLGSRSAKMLAPYSDDPAQRGTLVELALAGHLREWAQCVAALDLQPAIHAIGDEGVRVALDAIEGLPGHCRARIEHAQQLAREDLPRFACVWTSMQPGHKFADGPMLLGRVGAERLAGSFAFRSLRCAGARLAFGSDWPVVEPDVLAGIRCAVTGIVDGGSAMVTEENLTPAQAIEAYTRGAAEALHMDDRGFIEPGYRADFVLLDVDPFEWDWRGGVPRVLRTMRGGRTTFVG